MTETFRCLIMGAAGRDFHNFLTFFRDRPAFKVCAFTAAQIPFIESRTFPCSLAGPNYAADIPISPEQRLPELISELGIQFVFLSYSDLSHLEVMHKASLVQACGASFVLLGPRQTQLTSTKPVVSVTAVRTGVGKSPIAQWLARTLTASGTRVAALRHPMPYGDLERQAVQRFAAHEDLDHFDCTIEEREEYEPYIEHGLVVFAGVDYRPILTLAETEADVILWDGGNNDFSFVRPNVSVVVVDALRPGHETEYYPGESNLRSADIVVISKIGGVAAETLADLQKRIHTVNHAATVITADLDITVENPDAISGKRVVIVEDGPTLTHGGMSFGAGVRAAQRYGAKEVIDPRPFATGSVSEAYRQFPHLGPVVPALGYSAQQCWELRETIDRCGADIILDASPCRLDRVMELTTKLVRVRYQFRQVSGTPLLQLIESKLHIGSIQHR